MCLLFPGIPADFAAGVQMPEPAAPPKVVARKQETVAVEQAAMAPRVARGWNGQETGTKLNGIAAVDHHLSAGLRGQFLAMNDTAARKAGGVFVCFSDVVPMRQKDIVNAAHGLEAFDKMREELGRIDQPVAARPLHEITAASERLG